MPHSVHAKGAVSRAGRVAGKPVRRDAGIDMADRMATPSALADQAFTGVDESVGAECILAPTHSATLVRSVAASQNHRYLRVDQADE